MFFMRFLHLGHLHFSAGFLKISTRASRSPGGLPSCGVLDVTSEQHLCDPFMTTEAVRPKDLLSFSYRLGGPVHVSA